MATSKKNNIIVTILIVLGLAALYFLWQALQPEPQEPTEITIAAAASLKESLDEIQAQYTAQHKGVNILLTYASSGQLQQQIEQGAPADIFISAAQQQMDTLESKGLLAENTRKDVLRNDLVVLVPADSDKIKDLSDLSSSEVKQIAIGEPKTVPAGKYAQEALTSAGQWDKIQSKLVLATDVKKVLAYVESGDADAGFVYSSDAVVAKNAKVAIAVDKSLYSNIIYPVAIIKSSQQTAAAQDFINFLSDPEVKKIFVKYGFQVID